MIAAAESVGHAADRLDGQACILAERLNQLLGVRRGAGADHGQFVLVVEPADHVEVDHHHGRGERIERMLDVMPRAQQPAFLARERDEHHAAGQGVAPRRQPPGDFQHHGRPRCIVVGAVVDVAREERQRARQQSAAPQVVVMPADHDRLVRVRARSFEHSDDVLRHGRRPLDRDPRRGSDVLQYAGARLEVGIDLLLQLGERRLVGGFEDRVRVFARDVDERQVGKNVRPRVPEGQQRVLLVAQAREVVDQQNQLRAVLERVDGLVPQ